MAIARRYAKACDACYQKKLKCDFKSGQCTLCTKKQQPCIFTRRRKRRDPTRSSITDCKTQTNQTENTPPCRSQSLLASSSQSLLADGALPNISSLVQKRIHHVPEHETIDHLRAAGWIAGGTSCPFPDTLTLLPLVRGYFASFNHFCPLFNEERFMKRLETDYPPTKQKHPVWWASVCAVLGMAHRLRAMSNGSMDAEAQVPVCFYNRQALDTMPNLMFDDPCLDTARVLLLMAHVIKGTAMPDCAPLLVSTAIQILCALQIHRSGLVLEADHSDEDLDRRRVFWVALFQDVDNALRWNRPPVFRYDEVFVSPLEEYPHDRAGLASCIESDVEANFLTIKSRLVKVQGMVWSKLCSTRASAYPDPAPDETRDKLNMALADWKGELPFDFAAERLLGRWPKIAIVQITILAFAYFHTLVLVNRNDLTQEMAMGRLHFETLVQNHPFSTALLVVDAARDMLALNSLIPSGNLSCDWYYMDANISAVLCLLAHNLRNPLHHYRGHDMNAIETWLPSLLALTTQTKRADVAEKHDMFSSLLASTKQVICDAEIEAGIGSVAPLPGFE